MPERRRYNRYRLWLPAALGPPGGDRVDAVGHDMSRQGAMLVTTTPFDVGHQVILEVALPPSSERRMALRGEVRRCADNHEDPNGLWPYEVAVEFVEEHPEVEEQLRELLVALRIDTGG